jgi:hypothetical protein
VAKAQQTTPFVPQGVPPGCELVQAVSARASKQLLHRWV